MFKESEEVYPMTESIYVLAADYKFRRMSKYRAWDQYIIDTGLRPKMDAKDFYAIFEAVTAAPRKIYGVKPAGFVATHHDTMFDEDCEMHVDSLGVVHVVWESAHTGSYPPCNPPEVERFVKIEDHDDKHND